MDDRTELTIGYRLKDCQKMGVPIVIAFGKRAVGFLLSENRCNYFIVFFFRQNKTSAKLLMFTTIEQNICRMRTH